MSTRLSAPASRKPRRTKVSKAPFWVPFDNDGAGNWRYLPVDLAHHQMVVTHDEDGNPELPRNLYQAKGFIPLDMVQDPAALAKLPTNWRDVAAGRAEPVFRQADEDPAEADGLGA